MLFGLIMYLLGVLTVLGFLWGLFVRCVSSIDESQSLPF
jgi:hypothetical protein